MAKQRVNLFKIRNKRLAKLESQVQTPVNANREGNVDNDTASQPSKGPELQSAGHGQSTGQPAKGRTESGSQGMPKPSENPFSQLAPKSPNGDGPTINITRTGGRPLTPMKRPTSAAGRPSSRAGESLQEWEDRVLGGIFRLTLNPHTTEDSHGHHLEYVRGVREDLEQQGGPVGLSNGILDQAILEAASKVGENTPLDYLLECWKRVSRQFRSFRGEKVQDPKYNIIKEARRLCMSYCIFAVTMPDMFG